MMQIYPIDVAKTLYQKALLSAGSGHAERPRIKFFMYGGYRGNAVFCSSEKYTAIADSGTGLGVSVLRSCVINAIFFSNFELIKKHINALEV